MSSGKRQGTKAAVGGGSPPPGGRPEPGAARRKKKTCKKRSGKKKGKAGRKAGRKTNRIYTPDERREAVETYFKSGMTKKDFSQVWGISDVTLADWVTKYNKYGPKGLERKPHAGKGKIRIATAVRDEIVRAKRFFPDFGLKRVRDYLFRFRGVKVSEGSIGKTLKQAQIPPTPQPKKKRKRRKKVRRFERSKPGLLWQSDITSYVLTRHGARAHLTVFLDDFSRYVVSFALALHQKQDLVMEALLSGLDRFGKPREILTDQGRQYFSWRGKSHFQKYLDKQGVRHVVARSHHPQTLGKCERLWKTIRTEFWDRAQPQVIDEAREGLVHYFAHYNHHRPHQGIGGLVPADRFFGAESEVRKAMEAELSENELRMALGEKPRRSVYLVGRIGDKSVSMHGERGRLVIHAPDGGVESMTPRELGAPQEGYDGGSNDGNDEGRDVGNNDRREERGDVEQAALSSTSAQSELQSAEEGADAGAGALGVGDGGGAGDGAPDGGGDPGDVAGPGEPPGDFPAPERACAPDLAAVAASAVGPGGGSSQATEEEAVGGGDGGGGAEVEAAQENRENGEGACEPEAAGGHPEGSSGAQAKDDQEEEVVQGAERCQGVCQPGRDEGSAKTSWPTERA